MGRKDKVKKEGRYLTGASFQEFLDALRAFESGLDPANLSDYIAGYDDPAAINYFEITERNPGEEGTERAPKVDGAGAYVRRDMSYQEYFQILKVDEIWQAAGGNPTEDTIRQMQFKSTNPWNFVGYQLGEGVMSDAGVYKIPTVLWDDSFYYPRYYIFQDEHTWMDDEWEELVTAPWDPTKQILATRANFWEGEFTGRDGINSLDDLKDETKHEMAMRDAIWHNVDYILRNIDGQMTLEQALSKTWVDPQTSRTVRSSMSGIIASAHLSGAQATVDLLLHDVVVGDETGTSILSYMEQFGEALTIVDEPGVTMLSGTAVPERISCGIANTSSTTPAEGDVVDTGGSGGNNITVDCSEAPVHTQTITVQNATAGAGNPNNDLFYLMNYEFDVNNIYFTTEDYVSGTIVTVYNGGVEIKRFLFEGIFPPELTDEVAAEIILPSRSFTMDWFGNEETVVPDFRYPGDFILPAGGMAFRDVFFDRIDPAGVKACSMDPSNQSYFALQLLGYTDGGSNDLVVGMFVGFGGAFNDVRHGYRVNINDFHDDPNTPITLPNWNKGSDIMVLSGYENGFIDAQFQDVDGDVIFYPDHGEGDYDYRIIIPNVTWAEMLARDESADDAHKPILGLTGSLSEVSPYS